MKVKLILRHDTVANWSVANPVLAVGEVGIVVGTNPVQLKIGDGNTKWNKLAIQYLINSDIKEVVDAIPELITKVSDLSNRVKEIENGKD